MPTAIIVMLATIAEEVGAAPVDDCLVDVTRDQLARCESHGAPSVRKLSPASPRTNDGRRHPGPDPQRPFSQCCTVART
jgi:hypothetical protein